MASDARRIFQENKQRALAAASSLIRRITQSPTVQFSLPGCLRGKCVSCQSNLRLAEMDGLSKALCCFCLNRPPNGKPSRRHPAGSLCGACGCLRSSRHSFQLPEIHLVSFVLYSAEESGTNKLANREPPEVQEIIRINSVANMQRNIEMLLHVKKVNVGVRWFESRREGESTAAFSVTPELKSVHLMKKKKNQLLD